MHFLSSEHLKIHPYKEYDDISTDTGWEHFLGSPAVRASHFYTGGDSTSGQGDRIHSLSVQAKTKLYVLLRRWIISSCLVHGCQDKSSIVEFSWHLNIPWHPESLCIEGIPAAFWNHGFYITIKCCDMLSQDPTQRVTCYSLLILSRILSSHLVRNSLLIPDGSFPSINSSNLLLWW